MRLLMMVGLFQLPRVMTLLVTTGEQVQEWEELSLVEKKDSIPKGK